MKKKDVQPLSGGDLKMYSPRNEYRHACTRLKCSSPAISWAKPLPAVSPSFRTRLSLQAWSSRCSSAIVSHQDHPTAFVQVSDDPHLGFPAVADTIQPEFYQKKSRPHCFTTPPTFAPESSRLSEDRNGTLNHFKTTEMPCAPATTI